VAGYVAQASAPLSAALLACTRFPMLMRSFERALPGIPVIDPGAAVAAKAKEALLRAGLPAGESIQKARDVYYTSGDLAVFSAAAERLLGTEGYDIRPVRIKIP